MILRNLIPPALKTRIRNWQYQRQARAVLRAPQTQQTRLPQLDVALVVPVWNDTVRLQRLLTQARKMNCFAQIIVIDDGSDIPIPAADDLTLIRHQTPKGAGPARNTGLTAVTTSHLLYFDSDDLLTTELPYLLADLAETTTPFDFCLFKHADSRTATAGHWGQPDRDEALWQAAQHSIGALERAPATALPLLAQTANYPWNKIYRTAFLRTHHIGCADTPVHEDITLHWLGFLAASSVMTSDRVCAWHHVSATGGQQTNRRGAERLQVFNALAPVVAAADRLENVALQAALVSFMLDLFDWIADNIDPTYHTILDEKIADWFTGPIQPWRSNIAAYDPVIEAKINARLGL